MKKLTVFIVLAGIIICHPVLSYAQTADADTQQYGKPFQHVPDRRDAVIYQVNMRVFSKQGDFKGVMQRLDSIKALGVNVIYLMPIYPVGIKNTVNSPYCTRDYKAVNKEFGTLDDLRALVEGAHKRNMAVLLDWVANHTSYDHVWTVNKSWYLQDAAGNIVSPPGTGWNDVAQLNFKNSAMRQAMIAAMKYWVLAANTDGFRCDYADGPPVAFWKQAIDTLRNISTHKLLMLAEGARSKNYAAGFDYNFGFRFFEKMKDIYAHNHTVLAIDSLNKSDYAGTTEGQQIIRYTTNHDVNSSDGTPLELFGGEKGSIAAFVIAAYMKSVPMIYNGQEVGLPYKLTFPFTSTKIEWNGSTGITAEYKKILAFRNNSAAIRRGSLTAYSNTDVCAFTKQQGNETVLVIVNVRGKAANFTLPPALAGSSWKDGVTGRKMALSGSVDLEPYRYLILKKP